MWAEEPETPEEWMMRKEAAGVSVEYLSAVPARTLEMLTQYAHGWTFREIATHHDISGTRAQSIVQRAVRNLERMHEARGTRWHTDRGDCCGFPCEKPSPDAYESPLDPVPNAVCTRCADPFKSSNVGAVRWCESCRSGRCSVCRYSTCRCRVTATCESCGSVRTVKSGCAGKRCRPCYMAWLNRERDRSRDTRRRGESHPGAMLTVDDVRHIRRLYSNGTPVKRIARDIGRSYWTVHCVAKGRTWTHVDEASA